VNARIAELLLAERQRQFDATATLLDGMLTIHLSIAEADRWLKLYDTEWQQVVQAVEAARNGTPALSKPRCGVVECGLRIRPAGNDRWTHWTSGAGRRADKDHEAQPAGAQ
jgi:hypothetical protein